MNYSSFPFPISFSMEPTNLMLNGSSPPHLQQYYQPQQPQNAIYTNSVNANGKSIAFPPSKLADDFSKVKLQSNQIHEGNKSR